MFTTWLKCSCLIIVLYCVHTSYLHLQTSSYLLHGLTKGKITLCCNLTTTTPKPGLKSLQQPFWRADNDGRWNSNEALCASILQMCTAKILAGRMEFQYKLMQIEKMVASKIFGNEAHKAMSFLTLMLWRCSNLVANLGVHKWVVTRSLKMGYNRLTPIFTNDLVFSSTSNPMF